VREIRLRPSRAADHPEVLRILAARDASDFGVPDCRRTFLIDQWRIRDFEPAAHAVVAEDGRGLAGYGAVFSHGCLGFVDPAREGEGFGTSLLGWLESRGRALGHDHHRQRVAAGNGRGRALLEGAGYRPVRSVYAMACTLVGTPPSPAIPAGIALRPLDPRADASALHAADAAAFSAQPDYRPETFTAFYDEHLATPDLAPELSRVARRGDAIAGFTVCRRLEPDVGYIDLLAVAESERRRGLGSALLFGTLRAFTRARLTHAMLDVASDNARALRLYERAGMTARFCEDTFEKPVRA
jgi:mycothiol synthase